MICVGGGSMKRFGFLDRAVEYLKEAGMEVELFEGIEPDPSVETVMRGAEAMLKFEPDWIIAMGGGSPIDAAKAMWIKYEYPEITFEEMCKVFGIPPLRRKAHFCAISSTSGTATEVTAFSIITDYQKGIKYPIADFEITPDVAIVDPDLAETMPKKLVAHTGMDAMTHAIEAYVSTASSPVVDVHALAAIRLVRENIEKAVSSPDDLAARENMSLASLQAGLAFSNASLGAVHALAHSLGGFLDMPHGECNALLLEHVVRFNFAAAAERYRTVAGQLGIDTRGMAEPECAQRIVDELARLRASVGIAGGLADRGVRAADIAELAVHAVKDACIFTNPRRVSLADAQVIYGDAL